MIVAYHTKVPLASNLGVRVFRVLFLIMMPPNMPKSPAKDNKRSIKSLFPSSAGIVMNFHHYAVSKVRVMFFRTGERARLFHGHQKRKKRDLRVMSPPWLGSNPSPGAKLFDLGV